MKSKWQILISLIILSLAISIKIMNFPLVEMFQNKVFDTFQSFQPRQYQDVPVRIIDVDEASLKKIGQWPWPRNKIAAIVDRLHQAGVAVIVFDILFSEYDNTSPSRILPILAENYPEAKKRELEKIFTAMPEHDDIFAKSMQNTNVATGIMLDINNSDNNLAAKAGFSFAGSDPHRFLTDFSGMVTPVPELISAASGLGYLNSTPDRDGILRRVPLVMTYKSKFYPSLAMEALRLAQGAHSYVIKSAGASGETNFGQNTGITSIKVGDFVIPTDSSGKLWLYYTNYLPMRYIPAWKLFDKGFNTLSLAGNIIVIGTSAAGLKDIRITPLNPTTNGVEVHAQMIEQVLTGQYLQRPDWINGAEIVLMFLIGITLIVVIEALSAIWGAVFTVAVFAGAIEFSWHEFTINRLLVDPVTPGIAIIFLFVATTLMRYISSEKEKKYIRHAFSHYMSPDLVKELASDPDKLKLGGETKEISVLFSDIRGFTTISEQFSASGLTKFINSFLTPMTGIILDNKGTIDKYIGDCIMAFWNAPLNDADHARNACIAALAMLKGLDQFNAGQQSQAIQDKTKFIPVKIGIGINTGNCCVGNMGSDQRFDYSILGDDVNLASRLEGQSKSYGVNIIIGENTVAKISGFAVMEIDLIRVKGKTRPTRIYALLGDKAMAEGSGFIGASKIFYSFLELYRTGNVKAAKRKLDDFGKTITTSQDFDLKGLYELYKDRLKSFSKNPPDKDWDGVYTAQTK